MNTEVKEATLQLEVKKDAMRQRQSGEWVVSFTVNPTDIPKDLLSARMGTRYMMVIVEIGDDEKPVPPRHKSERDKALARIGQLCRTEKFWEFISSAAGVMITSEAECVAVVKNHLGVRSRSEILTDDAAYKKWKTLWLMYAGKYGVDVKDE